MKELGEIAEVLVIKDDRPEHWKNELGDLCGLCIKPMLDLAGMDFHKACEIGKQRKDEKIKHSQATVYYNDYDDDTNWHDDRLCEKKEVNKQEWCYWRSFEIERDTMINTLEREYIEDYSELV